MVLDGPALFVKERLALAKLTDTYDLLDPTTKQPVGVARDEPETWAKGLRLLVSKKLLPTCVNVYDGAGGVPVLSLRKGMSFLRPTVEVFGSDGRLLGSLRSKLFSLGGGFWIHDASGAPAGEVKGDWKGWNFAFRDRAGRVVGTISKQWSGIGKELFTSADSYVVALNDAAARHGGQAHFPLLLASGLAIDVIFKEKS